MKKAVVFSVVLSILCLMSALIPVSAADLEQFRVEVPASAVDILEGLDGTVQSRARNGLSSVVNSAGTLADTYDVLTDGVYCQEFHDKAKPLSYLNIPVCDNGGQEAYQAAGGDYSFNGVDKKYYYSIEYLTPNADASSFAMYFANEGTNDNIPDYQIDASFDILVSTDGGATYQLAWSSVEYIVDYASKANGLLVRVAGFTYDKGGNMMEKYFSDKNGHTLSCKYVVANFATSYYGVTNVVYACSNLRRNGNQGVPFYYSARITEFDVYNVTLDAKTLTPASVDPYIPTTAENTTAAAPESTEYPIITGAPVTTGEATTKAPEVTTAAPVVTTTPETKAEEKESGCGSSVSAVCSVAIACACAYILKKKH